MRDLRMKQQLAERMSKINGPVDLDRHFKNAGVKAGNVGNLMDTIWPFYFTFASATLEPNRTASVTFQVSQEASFIFMAMSKAIFERTGVGPNYTYTYIDPANENSDVAQAQGLVFQLKDAQSGRVFSLNPTPVDVLGDPTSPFVLQSPQMFLPNATVELTWSNTHPTKTYVPWMSCFGYRLRLENGSNILSLVTG